LSCPHTFSKKEKKKKQKEKKEKNMNKEKAKEIIKPGWHKLIDRAYAIVDLLPFAEISDVTTNHSMLQINFDATLDNSQQYVLDCISYKIERESAKMCEECGLNGFRRKDIAHSPCLCTTCYTIQYNNVMESVSP
jgi:hypothetical protein